MLRLSGQTFAEAITRIDPPLNKSGAKETRQNASRIINAIARTYERRIKKGEIGKSGKGPAGSLPAGNGNGSTGLVYGRIQSGKTRAMVTSAALAFDNLFQIVVVLTSSNNRLVTQTHKDFEDGLPGKIRVYSKQHFRQEIDQAKQILESGNGGVLIVCSKNVTRLSQAIVFLKEIRAREYPSIIFDDEGDQATLDNNTLRRSARNQLIPPTKIHQLLHDPAVSSLRKALPRHVFVSVTGTPAALLLQNADNRSRPQFTELLEAGKDYVGGETFFSQHDPHRNKLVTTIDSEERIGLLERGRADLPDGLKSAIRFFLLAAAAASTKLGWPDGNESKDKGYKMLCHPSVRNADQEKVASMVRSYLNDLSRAFSDSHHHLHNDLKESYEKLKKQTSSVPSLKSLLKIIKQNFNAREVLLVNKNTTSDDLNYSRYFNFLIGGNTLGRGLAIKSLLVTYYVRESRKTQADTMYQHARMFGYRKKTLPYTKVFLPPQLYERFRQIYLSDENLRRFIKKHKGNLDTFPIRIARDIRATRGSVLDARKVDVLIPGTQMFPNYPFFGIGSEAIRDRVLEKINKLLPDYESDGRKGKKISTKDAQQLLRIIKTKGTNVWSDKKMSSILSYLAEQLGDGVLLRYREANRTASDRDGLLDNGVLFGGDLTAGAAHSKPTLWIFSLAFKDKRQVDGWNGEKIIYPTLVLPEETHMILFNKS